MKKNNNRNKSIEARERTPVDDGDTRPDQQPSGEVAEPNFPVSDTASGTDADVNTLEDY